MNSRRSFPRLCWRWAWRACVSEYEQHEQQAGALQAQLEHVETQVGILTEQYAIIAADYKELAALLARV